MKPHRMPPEFEVDTIAAIATAPGEAGIAIIRLSGPAAFVLAEQLFDGSIRPAAIARRAILHGTIRRTDAAGPLDEVILLCFRGPHSYTGEDVIEIQGHGGRVVARRILQAALDAGARAAGPGEFTRRAFLNGRLDLVQAEAVADLIRAQSDRAASAALQQLSGSLSCSITSIYDVLVSVSADLEATMDFVEDELPDTVLPALEARLRSALADADRLLATWHEGHLLRDGARVVIAGEPNVGKSTLMNRLLARDRSIVTHLPGTTRDTIEEPLVLGGIPIQLIDTAGLREADCLVEQEGVRRAEAVIQTADVTVYVVDGSRPLTSGDSARLRTATPGRCLLVANKSDLGMAVNGASLPAGMPWVHTSLLHGDGLDALTAALVRILDVHTDAPPHAAISERHRQGLLAARAEVTAAIDILRRNDVDGAMLGAEHLRQALEELARITGRDYSVDLLDRIFSQFCIGK